MSESPIRYLRYCDLREKKGIDWSRVHLDRKEKAGQFPRRVSLGANTVAWIESEIDAWMKARAESRPFDTLRVA